MKDISTLGNYAVIMHPRVCILKGNVEHGEARYAVWVSTPNVAYYTAPIDARKFETLESAKEAAINTLNVLQRTCPVARIDVVSKHERLIALDQQIAAFNRFKRTIKKAPEQFEFDFEALENGK